MTLIILMPLYKTLLENKQFIEPFKDILGILRPLD